MSKIIFDIEFKDNSKYGASSYIAEFVRELGPEFIVSRPVIEKPRKNENKIEVKFSIDLGPKAK